MKALKFHYDGRALVDRLFITLKIVSEEDPNDILGYHLMNGYVHSIDNIHDSSDQLYHIHHTTTEYLHFFPGCKGKSNIKVLTHDINIKNDWDIATINFYKNIQKQYKQYYQTLNGTINMLIGRGLMDALEGYAKTDLLFKSRDEYQHILNIFEDKSSDDTARGAFCRLQVGDHQKYLGMFINKWMLEK